MKAGKKLIVCMLCVCAMVTGLLTGCGKKPMTDAEYAEIAKSTAADNAKKVVMNGWGMLCSWCRVPPYSSLCPKCLRRPSGMLEIELGW